MQAASEAAFYIELDELAHDEMHDLLDPNEITRLDAWLASQSDMATFFLGIIYLSDSFLNLSHLINRGLYT